ncbi:MAG: hypothetical protein ABL995_12780 [Bryobacteraceae bacterium]
MKLLLAFFTAVCALAQTPDDLAGQLPHLKRVFVDRMTGGETAAQMRDLIITSLQNARLFVVTENAERADGFLRGAAEDLVYTDQFATSEGTRSTSRASESTGTGRNRAAAALGLAGAENESTNVKERRHEAIATVRIVNKDGDVLWSTTQESNGAKFRGASADVADKITRQLVGDLERVRRVGK